MENGSVVVEDDRNSILGDAKHKILGQMKNQFISSSTGGASSSENDLQIDEEGEEEDTTDTDSTDKTDKPPLTDINLVKKPESEKSTDESESTEEVKPPIIMSFRKQAKSTKMKMTTRSALNRSGGEVEKKSPDHDSESEGPKRSTRRRSKDCNESVLQSAIARKEKSYNETAKPQRLTRQLKPTQKILDNIAAAAKDKSPSKKDKKRKVITDATKKRKSDASLEYPEAKCRRSGRLTQNSVVNNSESDSDTKTIEESNGLVEEQVNFSSHLDADSVAAQLIASRLCVCTSPTKYTPLSQTSIYCNGLDSINNRLIGCNNSVNKESAWMLRPSTRVPYMVLCKLHRQRLRDHHCCAMCGVFCTQGAFLQCLNKHLYHKNCKLSIGALECCPHCGSTDKHLNVTITMKTDTPLVYTASQCVASDRKPQTKPEKSEKVKKKTNKFQPQQSTNKKNQVKKVVSKKQVDMQKSFTESKLFKEFYDDVKQEKYDEEEDEMEMMALEEKTRLKIKKEVMDLEDDEESAPLIICEDELEELEKLEHRKHAESDGSPHSIQELFEAIRNGLYAEVATLLGENDINLNQLIKYPEIMDETNEEAESGTVLHYAAIHGLVPIMHMLKIADMDLNLPDSENNTPLMVAVSHFQAESLKYLTTAGASVTAKGTDGMTALHLACKCGNLQATKELLLAAAHIKGFIDCQDDGGWTPLVWACEHNHVDVVKLLLSEGSNPQIADVEGNVALHWAAFGGSIAIVELILNFGGKLDSVNDQGDTPLHIAARHDNYNCVMVFVTRGANFAIKNENEETALDCAPAGSKSHQTLVVNNKLKVLISKK